MSMSRSIFIDAPFLAGSTNSFGRIHGGKLKKSQFAETSGCLTNSMSDTNIFGFLRRVYGFILPQKT